MTTGELTSLIGIRAEQLAYIVLTRRDDLEVTRNQKLGTMDIDLAVTILQDGKETGQLLGVEVKGVRTRAGLRRLPEVEPRLRNVPFPFVLFVFNMENDEGYWRWLVEPVSGPNALPGAVRVTDTETLEPLTNEAVAGIVDRVRHWYQARLVRT